MRQKEIILDQSNTHRLDKLLSLLFDDHSRTYFQRLIKNGYITINGKVAKSRDIPDSGDTIIVKIPPIPTIRAEAEADIPIDFLYEDEHIIALNKAPGIVVHPAPGHLSGTIANAVMGRLQNYVDPIRPGIIHRLDKETSGVLLVAKNEMSHEKFSNLFAERLIEKRYLALTWGNPGERVVDLPIGRHTHNRQKMCVRADGKRAITKIKPLATAGELTLLEIEILTGRTHQIRAHLAHLNTPIIGDPLYGHKSINRRYDQERQLLHAFKIGFCHPFTGDQKHLEAPIPDDMRRFIEEKFAGQEIDLI